MDAYLEEEFYDILTYCIENPNAPDLESKKQRVSIIGKELHADGGTDAMENMFYSIEFRIKDELGWVKRKKVKLLLTDYHPKEKRHSKLQKKNLQKHFLGIIT